MGKRRNGFPKRDGSGKHHEWLPADDEANLTLSPYYVPTIEEIYAKAAELRAQRTAGDHEPNLDANAPPRRRSFE